MQDVVVLSLALWAAGATFLAWWSWRGWSLAQQQAQLTDRQKLADEVGLQEYRVTRRIGKQEQRQVRFGADELRRQVLGEMKEQLMQALVEDAVMVVRQEDVPAKPYIELDMRLTAATEYSGDPTLEPVDQAMEQAAPAEAAPRNGTTPPWAST